MLNPSRAALLVATIATGMIYLDQTAVYIILPSIQRSLDISLHDMQWIVNLYILFTTAPMLLFGVLGDRYGRVKICFIGMALFGFGSLACALAQSLAQILVFRAIQGCGASMIASVGLAIMHFHTPTDKRGRMIGTWASLTTMIIAIGPGMAGMITEISDWHLVFAINVPFALFALWLLKYRVPENCSDHPASRISWISTFLLLSGMSALLFGLIEISREGNSPILMVSLIGGGISCLGYFFYRQIHKKNSLIPSTVFTYKRFVAVNLVTLFQWLAISGLFFLLPLHLQWTQGYGVLETGLSMLPTSISVMVVSRYSGRIADHFSPLWPISFGIVCSGLAMVLLATSSSLEHYWSELFPITVLHGLGLGSLIAPLTAVAMSSLPVQFSGVASGVNNSASRISTMIAVALMGSLMVMLFEPKLENELQSINLSQVSQQLLLSQSDLLGNIDTTPFEPSQIRQQVSAAISRSITASFSTMMWLSASISLFSLMLVFYYQLAPRHRGRSFWADEIN